jgi:hypothetical protein
VFDREREHAVGAENDFAGKLAISSLAAAAASLSRPHADLMRSILAFYFARDSAESPRTRPVRVNTEHHCVSERRHAELLLFELRTNQSLVENGGRTSAESQLGALSLLHQICIKWLYVFLAYFIFINKHT